MEQLEKAAAEDTGTHRLHDRGRAGAGREPRDPGAAEQERMKGGKKVEEETKKALHACGRGGRGLQTNLGLYLHSKGK